MSTHYAIGIDIGGTSLRAALVSEEGRILNKTKVPSSCDVLASLKEAVKGLPRDGVSGVGNGVLVAAALILHEERVQN